MAVQPHDPVRGGFGRFDAWDWLDADYGCAGGIPVYVTLANGQRIIVRPLSKKRKVARAERKCKEVARYVTLFRLNDARYRR